MNANKRDDIAVLLINLGTPDKPNTPEVREYLKEFLMDKYVIRIPRLIWIPILYGIILNTRPQKSAQLYKKIWTDDGSPLLVHTKKQARLLQENLNKNESKNFKVEYAMRYGTPSIESKINFLYDEGYREIIVVPMFPQYSTTTTKSIEEKIRDIFNKKAKYSSLNLKLVKDFFQEHLYVKSTAETISEFQNENGLCQKILFSFHGIPKSYLGKDEPYKKQCITTANSIAKYLNLDRGSYEIVFQSRFGFSEWIKPYLSERLKQLPSEGINHIQVFCPGFVSDCLETLEEINDESKELFLKSNGKKFEYIPCINENKTFIQALENIVHRNSKL
tara:strand:+ start:69094 stop:70092 length:999 start_codon:yes stop_codon:yes gene_type:complete